MSNTVNPSEKVLSSNASLLLEFGEPVEDEEFLKELQYRLWSELLHRPTRSLQFPGSQPVSFSRKHLDLLEREDYYVCEKSDGVRYLLYYTSPYGKPTAYLIDRNFSCREIPGLTLPGRIKSTIHEDTLLDGELICENGKEDEKEKDFLFLIFDALLIGGRSILKESLPNRLKFVQNDVIAPFGGGRVNEEKREERKRGETGENNDGDDNNNDNDNDNNNRVDFKYPFRLEMKKMWKPYAIAEILEIEIPKLRHGNDGLIFTPVMDPYMAGTCERLLKWKPSELNTVDFKLVINNHHIDDGDGKVEQDKRYELHVASREHHRFFDWHRPDKVLDSLDGCIIECRFIPPRADHEEEEEGSNLTRPKGGGGGKWEFIRVRGDKVMANNERVVTKILDSIKDNVTAKQLIERIPFIRKAWKKRESLLLPPPPKRLRE